MIRQKNPHIDPQPDNQFVSMKIRTTLKSLITLTVFCFFTLVGLGQNEALKNFDALWDIFNENYASFEEKKIDWNLVREEYRPQITAATSEAQLYSIFEKMLKPLHDGHVSLRAKKIDSAFSASRTSRIINELKTLKKKDRKPQFKKMVAATLAEHGFKELKEIGPTFRDEKLFSYSDNGKVGYLRFMRSFSTMAKMKGASLNKQLDLIFDTFQNLDAIILDVRFNIGGDDAFSQTVAGRFVTEKIDGFYKQTRKNQKFGPLKTKYIKPTGTKPFLKPVILLTNDVTVSAADVLCMMMAPLENVTLIGEASNGSYSDLYNKTLPNGWKLTLSNQRYYDVNRNNYEGQGTPVDIEVLNTLEDFESLNDSVLSMAFKTLAAAE